MDEIHRHKKIDRIGILRKHPALSCRLHKLRQTGIWDCIILGESKPLGEVVDFWRRSEFQEKGTPHDHDLIAVKNDSIKQNDIINVDDAEAQRRVQDFVKSIITCKLQPNLIEGGIDHDEENGDEEGDKMCYMWNPLQVKRADGDSSVRREFFPDKYDPRRNFFPHSQYCKYKLSQNGREVPMLSFKLKKNGSFCDALTQHAYRKWQIANQMHDCTFTCWKFCKWWEDKQCRFMYPVDETLCSNCDVTINVTRDRKKRVRVKAMAPRNNGHLNNCPVSPLLALAHGGNIDVQYIHSPYGAAEYCSSYCSKAEAPDLQTLQNMFVKKLSNILLRRDDLSFADQLRSILNAIYCCTKISTVHACYTLLKLKFVESSRNVEAMNPLRRSQMTRQLLFNMNDLAHMDPLASAEKQSGPASTFGKRDAYAAFVKQQIGLGGCNVTMCHYLHRFALEGKMSMQKENAFHHLFYRWMS
jgi:hypothetical protein